MRPLSKSKSVIPTHGIQYIGTVKFVMTLQKTTITASDIPIIPPGCKTRFIKRIYKQRDSRGSLRYTWYEPAPNQPFHTAHAAKN